MWDLSSPTRDQTGVPCSERWIFFGRGGGDFYFFYWRIIVYRILLFSVKPQERWILNHWTTREVPIIFFKSTFIADQLQHIHGSSPLSASMPLAMGLCSSSHLEGLASGVAPTNRMQKWWCASSQRPQETLHASAIFLGPWLCHTKSKHNGGWWTTWRGRKGLQLTASKPQPVSKSAADHTHMKEPSWLQSSWTQPELPVVSSTKHPSFKLLCWSSLFCSSSELVQLSIKLPLKKSTMKSWV